MAYAVNINNAEGKPEGVAFDRLKYLKKALDDCEGLTIDEFNEKAGTVSIDDEAGRLVFQGSIADALEFVDGYPAQHAKVEKLERHVTALRGIIMSIAQGRPEVAERLAERMLTEIGVDLRDEKRFKGGRVFADNVDIDVTTYGRGGPDA